jgi:DNA-binding winged helix-turn-helix (wHTH) protein
MDERRFFFGRCELRPGSHELLVDGQTCPLKPLAYDLLLYLLTHRGRTVTKDELLDNVWGGRAVTVGAIARAVMLVRQAIRDEGESPMLCTEHRIGYRFAGAVRVEAPPAPEPAPPSTEESIVIALLPTARAGDAPLDRSTRTPLSLVGYAMATDLRLVPLSMYAVEAALKDLPGDASPDAQVTALRRREHVQHVVQVRIGMSSAGCRLDHCLLTVPGQTPSTLLAHDPVEAGDLLARHIMAVLRPGDPTQGGFALRDTWTLQLFARAMQASAQGQWKRAAHLLRVVLDCMPRHPGAQQALARAEAMLRGAPPRA